jgi:membrane-associated phospholipid phosphatase
MATSNISRTRMPKSKHRRRATIFQGYLVVAIILFAILAVLAHTIAYFTFDVTITREVQAFRAGWFDGLMRALSWIGFAPQVNLISFLILLFLYANGLKWEAVVAFASVVGISVQGLGIKLLVDRPRPSTDLVNVLSQLRDYSFPSGHVLYFTAFFGFLVFLAYTLLKHSWWRTLLLVILGGMVALIGLSRIYAGQHWASDVLAAYLLGSVWLAMSVYVYRWGKANRLMHCPKIEDVPNPNR